MVLHVVYLVGLLTFAAVLGIVCDDIGTQVDKVRKAHTYYQAGTYYQLTRPALAKRFPSD